jgi:hypothetical protein
MPTWVWILLSLTALGFFLRLLDERMGLNATERYGKALAIMFILAVLGGLILGFMNAEWR